MQRTTLAIAISFLTAFTSAASSAEKEQSALVMGFGMTPCGQFGQEYGRNVSIEITYFSWAQGFMSGINTLAFAQKGRTRELQAIPVEKQMEKIRIYCNEHPLENYLGAAAHLYADLPFRP